MSIAGFKRCSSPSINGHHLNLKQPISNALTARRRRKKKTNMRMAMMMMSTTKTTNTFLSSSVTSWESLRLRGFDSFHSFIIIHPSINPSTHLYFIHLSIQPLIHTSIHPSIFSFFYLTSFRSSNQKQPICSVLPFFIHPPPIHSIFPIRPSHHLNPLADLPIHPSTLPSIHPSIHSLIHHIPTHPSYIHSFLIYLSIHPSFHPSIHPPCSDKFQGSP